MKSEEKTGKSIGRHRQRDALRVWSKLQVRMTMSYVVVSVVTALLLELLLILIFIFVISRLPFADQEAQAAAKSAAQFYALEAAVQANGNTLDPHSTFQAGHPSSLAAPVGISSNSPSIAFVLLVAPGGQVLASSDPKHYPVATPIARELSDQQQVQLVLAALAGRAGSVAQGHVVSAAQPVLNHQKLPIGAIYVQMLPMSFGGNIFSYAELWLGTGVFWLILTVPVGAIFGVLTTRSLVRRLHGLVNATSQFAQGDYTQRVAVSRQDEIGQLERQFNSMAEQLVESIEQHARLEAISTFSSRLKLVGWVSSSAMPRIKAYRRPC